MPVLTGMVWPPAGILPAKPVFPGDRSTYTMETPRLIINRPAENDLAALHELFEVTVRDTFAREGISEALHGDLQSEIDGLKATLQRDVDSDGTLEYFLVARLGGRVVGTVATGPSGRFMQSNVVADFTVTPEIKCLYVHPEHQGQGIGSRLFDAMIEHLRRSGVTQCCFDSGYRQAQRCWLKKAGEPTVVLENYWGDGADHMFWLLSLTSERPK